MKKISYQYCVKSNHGTEDHPAYVDTFLGKTLVCRTAEEYEQGIQTAKQEAYKGKYTVEDVPDPVPVAPRNITAGEYFTIDGVLYKATDNIPNGEPIITGQNANETTIEEQLAELAKGE